MDIGLYSMPKGKLVGFGRPLSTADLGVKINLGIEDKYPSPSDHSDIQNYIKDSIDIPYVSDIGVEFNNLVPPTYTTEVEWIASIVVRTNESELLLKDILQGTGDIGKIETAVKASVAEAGYNTVDGQIEVSVFAI